MAKSNPNLTSIFTDVANSIRAKKGTSEDIYPVDFADEIATITGGGDQPQLHAVTGLSQSVGIATWTGDSYTEAYKLYLDNGLVDTLTTALYDLTTLTVTIGSHTFGVAATATNFVDSTPSTLTFAKHSITVNIINGTYSGPSTMYNWDTVQLAITPNEGLNVEITSVTNANYSFTSSTNVLTLLNSTGNVTVNIECKADVSYIIGFRGMSQSDPTLTRTGDAVGATWAKSNNNIEVTGINMSKIWGGYIGNDGETLTWDSTNSKYLYNGEEYTGNVFSKINRFFCKSYYETIDGEQILDGYDLCFAPTAPDATWQDWFFGKEYVGISCYASNLPASKNQPLSSKQGVNPGYTYTAEEIISAYKRNSSTIGNIHNIWYNELAILQLLFMTIFATKQYTNVFKYGRAATHTCGYLDQYRSSSSISTCALNNNRYSGGNMFLGIEDFSYYYLFICGIVLRNDAYFVSTDYSSFGFYSTTNTSLTKSNITNSGKTLKYLQENTSFPGVLVPYSTSDTNDAYFCSKLYIPSSSTGMYGISACSAYSDNYDGIFFYLLNGAITSGQGQLTTYSARITLMPN